MWQLKSTTCSVLSRGSVLELSTKTHSKCCTPLWCVPLFVVLPKFGLHKHQCWIIKVEKVQRGASRFTYTNNELSYKGTLFSLNLIPLNYWLGYLGTLFFLKCKLGYIKICVDRDVSVWTRRLRHGASERFLNNVNAKTSPFRNSFFVRI